MVSSHKAGKLAEYCLILSFLLFNAGCNITSPNYRPQWSSLLHRSAKIPSDASKDEIIAYVNQHIKPIHSWRSTSARVHLSGVPVPLKAMLAVEQPRQLRFTVSGGLSGQSEFDIGSSREQVWFFVRRMEPKAIMTVKHEQLDQIKNQMPIPFQPEWLMEVLNVSTIDAESSELSRDPDQPYVVKLVSHHISKQGQEIRKITTVDLRKGEVRDHQLFDSQHRLLAKAKLTDYRQFPNTEARLPYDIRLEFAQQDQSMHIVLRSVEVNPPRLPEELWAVPQLAEYPVHELGQEELIGSPAAFANRHLRDKPRAITNYELDTKTGAWVQDQIIQTAQTDSAPPFVPQRAQQADHQLSSDAIPFSTHAFDSHPPQAGAGKKARPAPLADRPSPFSDKPQQKPSQQAPSQKTPGHKAKTSSPEIPEWARGYEPHKSQKPITEPSGFELTEVHSSAN